MGACVCAESLQSCPTLCNHMDYSLLGSLVHGILQARVLKWLAMLSSRKFSRPRNQTHISYVSCIARWVLYHQHRLGSPTWAHTAADPYKDLRCFSKCETFPFDIKVICSLQDLLSLVKRKRTTKLLLSTAPGDMTVCNS